ATHDQRVDDGCADRGNFREDASEFRGRDVQNFGISGCHAHAGQGRSSLQHRDVAQEIALPSSGEDLFGAIALLENLELAAQNHGQTEIALSSFENEIAALQDAPFSERFEQRKLVIVQLWERDAFGIPVKLLVLFLARRSEEHTSELQSR